MKPRIIATSLLLAFVVVSVLFLVLKERRGERPPGDANGGRVQQSARTTAAPPRTGSDAAAAGRREDAGAVSDGIIVYYFHATRRCATCRAFEDYTREAITARYPDELKNGTLMWRVVNVDEPANQHYVRDYSLSTKSIVLVDVSHGREIRRKNLSRIWDLVGDKAAFISYVQSEIDDFGKGR
jgi:hypothetical protein